MRILTAESMSAVDRTAVEEFGIPTLVLMENAAIGLADAIAESFPEVRSAAVFCGPGNNGGDGLALGRHLAIRGYHVELWLFAGGRPLRGDAAIQLGICRNQGLAIREMSAEDSVRGAVERARGLELLVDALFGVGLSRPLEGQYEELVEALNQVPLPRVAVDLPSGLYGSRWEIPGAHLEADLTVTFGAPKVAHIFAPAAAAVGDVVVADLGIPPELVERAEGDLHLLTAEELAARLMPRPAASHKGDYGHLVIVAGGPGKAGAAILAARAAVRGGAGLVTVAAPRSIAATVDLGSVESMTFALSEAAEGGLAPSAVDELQGLAAGKTAVALGPGLGLEGATPAAIRAAVLGLRLPLVLDADGVNAFAGRAAELQGRREPTVLTPHPGELGRLLGTTSAEIQADRVAAARRAARETAAITVLKGHQTLVAAPGGPVLVNPTGNPGMASGGCGDVLTGLLAGLIAQGYEPLPAAGLAVYLHGLAGDRAAARLGEAPLAAGDLLEALPEAFAALQDGE